MHGYTQKLIAKAIIADNVLTECLAEVTRPQDHDVAVSMPFSKCR